VLVDFAGNAERRIGRRVEKLSRAALDEYMRRTLALAVVLAAAAGATYRIATERTAAPPQLPPVIESAVTATAPTTTDATQTSPSKALADESPPVNTTLSDEERAAAIKRGISNALSKTRDYYAKALEDAGLASADSQRIAKQFVDEVAGCVFEAARAESEARGTDPKEFLTGAEIIWSQPTDAAFVMIARVRSNAVPCVANAYQAAGIQMPDNFTANNDAPEPTTASAPPPPWAGEMEARIREHISSYGSLELTGVLVKCREEGCNALIGGHDIPIFDLDFDVFAERNGFRHALVGGDSNHRTVWLQRE
jgi:hypothetical protein